MEDDARALLPNRRALIMPSASGGVARLVYSRLREHNIPATPLLAKAGLSVEQIDDRSARVKARSQIRFLELAADALQDDLLGFHLARDYDLREIGLLYYVLASSEVLHDALQKAARYSGITNEGVSLKFRATREAAITLDYIGVERRSDCHQIEFWLLSLVRLCRQLANRRLIPSRIRVVHHRKKMPAEFRSLAGMRGRIWVRGGRGGFPRCGRKYGNRQRRHPSQQTADEILRRGPRPSGAGASHPALKRGERHGAVASARTGERRRDRPPARHELPDAGAQACRGRIDLLADRGGTEGRPRQALPAGWRSTDFADRLAARLSRSQRLHPRLQAMDWNDAKTGTGAKSSRDCRTSPHKPSMPGGVSRPISGRFGVPALSCRLTPPRQAPVGRHRCPPRSAAWRDGC